MSLEKVMSHPLTRLIANSEVRIMGIREDQEVLIRIIAKELNLDFEMLNTSLRFRGLVND